MANDFEFDADARRRVLDRIAQTPKPSSKPTLDHAAVLFGPLPLWVAVSGQPTIAGLVQLDDRLLSHAVRKRLLDDEELSGQPLYRAVSSMPRLSTQLEYEAALEWTLEIVALAVILGVRAAFLAAGLNGVTIDEEIGRQLKSVISSLRFCAVCGAPFRRSRLRPRTCGQPACRRRPTARKRPGHAAKVAESRWRQFLKDAIPVLKAHKPNIRGGDQTLQNLLEQFRRNDPKAEGVIDNLADTNDPAIRRLAVRLSRYRGGRPRKERSSR
jgi:hypothetical protein